MGLAREIIRADATLVISRAYDREAHLDPARRGAYLVLIPGQVPEIVLDGLASEHEQHHGEARCRRELERAQQDALAAGALDQEKEQQRRLLVRIEPDVVVTCVRDPLIHLDPTRRGAYLHLVPGKVPEIVLDGLASEHEQQEGERRCREQLQRPQREGSNGRRTSSDGAKRLRELLKQRRQSCPGSSSPTPVSTPPPRPSPPPLTISLEPPGRTPVPRPTPVPGRTPVPRLMPSPASHTPVPRTATQGHAPSRGTLRGGRLGERLVARGVVNPKSVLRALDRQARLPRGAAVRRLGSLLIEDGAVGLSTMLEALAEQRGATAAPPLTEADPQLLELVPLQALRELRVAPLELRDGALLIAVCDPQESDALATLEALAGRPVRPLLAPQVQVERILRSLART